MEETKAPLFHLFFDKRVCLYAATRQLQEAI